MPLKTSLSKNEASRLLCFEAVLHSLGSEVSKMDHHIMEPSTVYLCKGNLHICDDAINAEMYIVI